MNRANPSLSVSPEQPVTTVIERFAASDGPASNGPASDGPMADAVAAAVHHAEVRWRADPLFVAAAVLRGRTPRGGLAVYSQWRHIGQPPHTVPVDWSLVDALPGVAPQPRESHTYAVDFTALSASHSSPLRLDCAATPLAHFGVFSMSRDHQAAMLELARVNAPNSLVTPDIVGVSFHRSLDGIRVVNLGAWTSFESFTQLLSRPGFHEDDKYWTGVAEFEPDFFDVAAVVTSQ